MEISFSVIFLVMPFCFVLSLFKDLLKCVVNDSGILPSIRTVIPFRRGDPFFFSSSSAGHKAQGMPNDAGVMSDSFFLFQCAYLEGANWGWPFVLPTHRFVYFMSFDEIRKKERSSTPKIRRALLKKDFVFFFFECIEGTKKKAFPLIVPALQSSQLSLSRIT